MCKCARNQDSNYILRDCANWGGSVCVCVYVRAGARVGVCECVSMLMGGWVFACPPACVSACVLECVHVCPRKQYHNYLPG